MVMNNKLLQFYVCTEEQGFVQKKNHYQNILDKQQHTNLALGMKAHNSRVL